LLRTQPPGSKERQDTFARMDGVIKRIQALNKAGASPELKSLLDQDAQLTEQLSKVNPADEAAYNKIRAQIDALAPQIQKARQSPENNEQRIKDLTAEWRRRDTLITRETSPSEFSGTFTAVLGGNPENLAQTPQNDDRLTITYRPGIDFAGNAEVSALASQIQSRLGMEVEIRGNVISIKPISGSDAGLFVEGKVMTGLRHLLWDQLKQIGDRAGEKGKVAPPATPEPAPGPSLIGPDPVLPPGTLPEPSPPLGPDPVVPPGTLPEPGPPLGPDAVPPSPGTPEPEPTPTPTPESAPDAVENLREVSAQQFDREALIIAIETLELGEGIRPITTANVANITNALIVERMIENFSTAFRNRNFLQRRGVVCDAEGNLRQYQPGSDDPYAGPIITSNWATLLRGSPVTGLQILARACTDPGPNLSIFNPSGLLKYSVSRINGEQAERPTLLDRLSELSSTTRPRVENRDSEATRRAQEFVVADLHARLMIRLEDRIGALKGNIANPGGITWKERVAENAIAYGAAGALGGGPIGIGALGAYDGINAGREFLGMGRFNNPIDVRPTNIEAMQKQREGTALKANEALYQELSAMNLSGTMTSQVNALQSIWDRMDQEGKVNYAEFTQRLEWARTLCDWAETGLSWADTAGQTFAQRVPVIGPLLYSVLRNGVGMLAGERVRDANGGYRDLDWGDFAINVVTDQIPLGSIANLVPGARPLARLTVRRLLRDIPRRMVRATLEEARDRIKEPIRLVATRLNEGATWGQVVDELSQIQPDYTSFFLSAGVRFLADIAGDTAAQRIRGMLARGIPSIPRNWRPLSLSNGKQVAEQARKLARNDMNAQATELIDMISKSEEQNPERP
ncbi:MAG: hypothetical protein HOO67_07315, partial [Candidatus Peribacteraceae bacterium]|nr:hypothetical protein [Candidatus Peribacteraceae bacterium]